MPDPKAKDSIVEQAQTLHEYLKTDKRHNGFLPRPFCIEFGGTPASGKTTAIKELDRFLRRNGFRVYTPQEGAEAIRHVGRETPLYNFRTQFYALQILIDETQTHRFDAVIFDRCIFDAYSWMLFYFENGQLSLAEFQTWKSLLFSRFWANSIDAAYFMVCDPEVALARELRIARLKQPGRSTSPESIRQKIDQFRRIHRELSPSFSQLELVDTTAMTEEKMVDHIISRTLEKLQRKVAEPVGTGTVSGP